MAPGFQSQDTQWVFLSASPERLEALEKALGHLRAQMRLGKNSFRAKQPSPAELEAVPLWTDDYTDLFGVLRPLFSLGRRERT